MKFTKLENLRIKQHRKFKILLSIAISLTAATILYLLTIATSFDMDMTSPIILFILFGIAMLFYILAQKAKTTFANSVKEVIIENILENKFEEFDFKINSYIPKKIVNEVGIFQKPSRVSGEDYIKGRYKNVTFEVSDLKLETSNGDTTHTFFKGRWFIFKFNKNFNETIKLVDGSRYGIKTKDMSKEETESTSFNKKYHMYTTNKTFFYKFMTPLMIDKLMTFYDKAKGKVSFALIDNELHIAIYDNGDFLKIDIKRPVTDQVMVTLRKEINQIIEIIEYLELDSKTFD